MRGEKSQIRCEIQTHTQRIGSRRKRVCYPGEKLRVLTPQMGSKISRCAAPRWFVTGLENYIMEYNHFQDVPLSSILLLCSPAMCLGEICEHV